MPGAGYHVNGSRSRPRNVINLHRQNRGGALNDLGKVLDCVIVQAERDAEAVAQRPCEHARASGRAYKGEMRDLEPDGTRGRPLADHDIEREVFHRRIENPSTGTVQPVDLADEEYVARLKIG